MRQRRVWVWNSPDGEMYFGTLKRAMAYVDSLWPGEITWSQGFDTWIGAHPNDVDPEDEPTAKIYPVEVH